MNIVLPQNQISNITTKELSNKIGEKISLYACVSKKIQKSSFYFIMLRTESEIIQSVYRKDKCSGDFSLLHEGSYVKVCAIIKSSTRSVNNIELDLIDFIVYTSPNSTFPVPISDKTPDVSFEEKLKYRSLSIRHTSEALIFKVKSTICSEFCNYFNKYGYNYIQTPIIVPSLSEDTENHAFTIDYFGNKAYLSQSSEYYKSMAICSLFKVYEISSSFRANKHGSSRHLNEFTTLNFEQAFITDLSDLLSIITDLIISITSSLSKICYDSFSYYGINCPNVKNIPMLSFNDAMNILNKNSSVDLDPTDEKKIFEYSKSNYNSDFVFITNFPKDKQPFYIARKDKLTTESFSLLYKGIEIASGGLKISTEDELQNQLREKKLKIESVGKYADIFKFGVPPHGGAVIGLERFVMQLLELDNIRKASMFPRDLHYFD